MLGHRRSRNKEGKPAYAMMTTQNTHSRHCTLECCDSNRLRVSTEWHDRQLAQPALRRGRVGIAWLTDQDRLEIMRGCETSGVGEV